MDEYFEKLEHTRKAIEDLFQVNLSLRDADTVPKSLLNYMSLTRAEIISELNRVHAILDPDDDDQMRPIQ